MDAVYRLFCSNLRGVIKYYLVFLQKNSNDVNAVSDSLRRENIAFVGLGCSLGYALCYQLPKIWLVFWFKDLVKSFVAPLVNPHVVWISTQLINVQCFPLHARESSEKSSVNTRNLQNQYYAKRIGNVFVLKNLIQDGIPCAFNKTVGCVWIDLPLNYQNFGCAGFSADFKEGANSFCKLFFCIDLLECNHLNVASVIA